MGVETVCGIHADVTINWRDNPRCGNRLDVGLLGGRGIAERNSSVARPFLHLTLDQDAMPLWPVASTATSSSADPTDACWTASPSRILRSTRAPHHRACVPLGPLNKSSPSTANRLLSVSGEARGRPGDLVQARPHPAAAAPLWHGAPNVPRRAREAVATLCAPDVSAACIDFHSWLWTQLYGVTAPTMGLGSGESPNGCKLTPRRAPYSWSEPSRTLSASCYAWGIPERATCTMQDRSVGVRPRSSLM